MYADCTTQCENNNYSYFSRCSVPCGAGSFMSTTGQDCPNVTVTDCNLMTCTTGGMVVAPTLFAPSSPTPSFYQVCLATDTPTDFLSSTRCLAKCASSQSCLFAWQSATNGNVTLSSDLPTMSTPIVKFWSYSSLAQCVAPTWDMVGATCLYICEDPENTQFSRFTNQFGFSYDPIRGLVFPFEDGSMSCPLTPDMLTNTCATPDNAGDLLGNTLNLSQMGGLGVIPGMMANYPFSDDASKELGGYTFKCPISIDCVYQSWTDAGAWGQCSQETNANDEGTRSRNRTILSQPQFLGDPCQVEQLIEYSQCNRSLTLNSSTDMWCPLYANESNVVKSVSEYACHKICSDMRALYGPDACNSMQIYEETPVGSRAPEVFLLQFPGAVSSSSITNAGVLSLPPNFQVASRAQLEGAWSSGMQSCFPGWFLNGPQEPAQALSIQQMGCGSNPSNSLSIFSPQSDIRNVWIFGNKTNFNNLSLSNFTVYDFFTPTTFSSMWDPKYLFSSQTFQSERTCAFFTDRTDVLVGDCTSLSARPGVVSSKLLDVPYSFAQNCSLSDWVTIHDCSQSCALVNAQTRTVVNTYSSEGGLPCSRIATYRASPCGASFSCPQTFSDVCILPVLPTLSAYATSCSSVDFAPDVFLEHFSQPYVYTWSLLLSITQQLNTTGGLLQYFSSTVRQNSQGGTLSVNVLHALNAQCGGDTSCLSLSDGYYSLSSVQAPLGWFKLNSGQTCTTNSSLQTCLSGRPSVPLNLLGKNVFDLGTSAWKCPSTCRPGGLSFSCAMGTTPLGECDCTPPYFNPPDPPKQTEFLIYSSYTSVSTQNNDTKTLYSCNQVPFPFRFGCSSSSLCEPQPCKIGNDGSACNSFSRNGECDTNFGTCTCVSPPPTLSKELCNSGCELGRNGLQCSGEGVCEYQEDQDDFKCTCNAGRTGDRCENAGSGLVGLLESLLYQGTGNILQVKQGTTQQTLPFSFTNYEPRCDNQTTPYCAGAQLFAPPEEAGTYIFHGFYPPVTRISYTTRSTGMGLDNKIVPQDYSNICVNSNDASFNSQWIGSNYLSVPLVSFTGGVNVPIQCQDFLDAQGKEVFTITARFTSNSNIPPNLHNRLFYTRCPDNVSQYSVQDSNIFYKFLHINQYDSAGNLLFNLVNTQTSLDNLCPNPTL